MSRRSEMGNGSQRDNPALVSVVICTYNRARLLPRAVESLVWQTLTDWECIIIDDGSTDNTSSYAETLVQIDQRFRYFWQENGGLTAARNAGLTRSTAPWVTFLDSDDEYEPEHLEVRLNLLASEPQTDLLYGGTQVVGGPEYVPDLHDPSRSIALAECFIGGTFFLRRQWAIAMGGFQRPDYGNDHDFAQRAIAADAIIRRTDVPTYIYHRDSPDSMCNLMENSCQRQFCG
jgi:glycosyltransferase involved in cell wall biosynthesis